jgi:maleamate amidohydrolase
MIHPFEDHCWQDVVPPDVLELYKHYHRDLYVGEAPALIAIDLYESAYRGGARPVMEVAKTYPSSPTQRLFAAARAAGLPIFYSTGETRDDAKPAAVRATNRRMAGAESDDYEIKAEFKPQPGDTIIRKMRASAFFGTPLIAHLTQLGIKSVVMLGESTSGCLRASAVDAYSHGFHVTLAEECCYDRSMISHKINLFDLHHKYADVMKTDDIVAHLESKALVGAR